MAMSDSASLIMIQFLSWLADRPRSYTETMDAWRTSCPRLSVWEDAIIADLVRIENDRGRAVRLTERGVGLLRQAQHQAAAAGSAQSERAGELALGTGRRG
jgi:hypothetical protein